MNKQQTQQPVAWVVYNGWRKELPFLTEEAARDFVNAEQLHFDLSGSLAAYRVVPTFTAPPVPRDVLMAALGDCRAECAKHYLGDADESEINLAAIADRYAGKVQDDQPTVQDYEDVLADHRKLVRELDVLLNGEDGAAKQAKLCDIVAQVSRMKAQPEPVNQQMLAALKLGKNSLVAFKLMPGQSNAWEEHDEANLVAINSAIAAAEAAQPVGLEPVEGDLLPAIGEEVLIHLASSDKWVPHRVVGYYAWGDRGGNNSLHRVFVRVVDRDGYQNARLLCDVRRTGEGRTQQPASAQPAPSGRFVDSFRGDNSLLLASIHALIELDASGSLVPHGIGGHARSLLNAAAARLESGAQPVAVPDGYAQGVEAVAKMLEKKADDFASENGYDDMGSLSFGGNLNGELMRDYHSGLLELAEEVRAMKTDCQHPAIAKTVAVPEGARHWAYRRYGSEPQKGYTIVSRAAGATHGGTPVAYLGDGELAGDAVQAICEAHNAALAAVAVPDEIDPDKAPWAPAEMEPDIAYADGWNACRAAMLSAAQKGGAA